MGLGLAICRMIIEHHGGQLTASSDGKNGSLFQFDLPIGSIEKGSAGVLKFQTELMSAFGTKRTWRSRSVMSAFGGKADIPSGHLDVRY